MSFTFDLIERERNVAYTFDLNEPIESECNSVLRELHDFHIAAERVVAPLRGGIVKPESRKTYPSVPKSLGPFLRKAILDLERIQREEVANSVQRVDAAKNINPPKPVNIDFSYASNEWNKNKYRDGNLIRYYPTCGQLTVHGTMCKFNRDTCVHHSPTKHGIRIDYPHAGYEKCGYPTKRGTPCTREKNKCIFHRVATYETCGHPTQRGSPCTKEKYICTYHQ